MTLLGIVIYSVWRWWQFLQAVFHILGQGVLSLPVSIGHVDACKVDILASKEEEDDDRDAGDDVHVDQQFGGASDVEM